MGRLLVLGATSRVGGHLLAHPPSGWTLESAGRTDPRSQGLKVARHATLDLRDERAVRRYLAASGADVWVNYAARTDVDGCETERPAGAPTTTDRGAPGSAWQVNAELPGWLAEEAHRADRPLVHLSTDFVFDGADGPYAETARPSDFGPRVGWYGYTKGLGEARARRPGGKVTLLRISNPYGGPLGPRGDLAGLLLARQRAGTLFPLYTDQLLTPTYIPDVTRTIAVLLQGAHPPVVHVAAPEPTTPFAFGQTLFREAGLTSTEVRPSLLGEGAPGRAPRPLRGGLRIAEVRRLGVEPLDHEAGLRAWAREFLRPRPEGQPARPDAADAKSRS